MMIFLLYKKIFLSDQKLIIVSAKFTPLLNLGKLVLRSTSPSHPAAIALYLNYELRGDTFTRPDQSLLQNIKIPIPVLAKIIQKLCNAKKISRSTRAP